jgi:superfamily I DNA and/or RNA helicase
VAYLFLNFAANSLRKQYKDLTLRYTQLEMLQYKEFIHACFPVGLEKEYFISMPNFIRESPNSSIFLKNIAIRSMRDVFSENILPKGFEVILIGNIRINPYGEFIVKGIELINVSILKHGETPKRAIAESAFINKNVGNIQPVIVSSYSFTPDVNSSILTSDFMGDLYTSSYTVPDPTIPRGIYNNWKEYTKFRLHYLAKQDEEKLPFDCCEAIKCYIIPQRDYQDAQEKYDDFILDGLDSTKKEEQIIVTKKFDNSEPFELIQITINKNKKELFVETVRGRGEIPVYEQKLKRFTRSEITLQNENGEKWINVGERYRLFYKDLQPDYSKIESDNKEALESEHNNIEGRYAAELKQEVKEYINRRTAELENNAKTKLFEYKDDLDNRLEQDVAENKDDLMRRSYSAQIKQIEDTIQKQIKNMEKKYKERIDSSRRKKEGKPDEEAIKKLEQQCDDERKVFENDLIQQKDSVSLKAFYERRNNRLVSQRESKLKEEMEVEFRRNQEEKTHEIQARQKTQIQNDKEIAKRLYSDALIEEKKDLADNQTFRCYYIYFKLQPDDTPDKINDEVKKITPKYIKFDQRAERTKINRQDVTLNNLFEGSVKNPFLATYLFAPHELSEIGTDIPEPEYFSGRLNNKQKEAVKKAVASESIFLLQGPPGTGKTEVIAEIAAQLAKRGKRILISSETHKAIDNVFERLPKIPEIRPLRLIPSESKKEPSPYSTERLVDNFYINISDSMDKEVEKFYHFYEDKEKFGEEYKKLCIEYERLNKEKSHIDNVQSTLDGIERERNGLEQKHDVENETLRLTLEEKDELFRRLKRIESFNLSADNESEKHMIEEFLSILQSYHILNQDFSTLMLIYKSDIFEIKEEIALLSGNPELTRLESKRAYVRTQMRGLRDPDTEEPIAGKETEYDTLRKSLINLSSQIKALENAKKSDKSELRITKIINNAALEQNMLASLMDIFVKIKTELVDKINTLKDHAGAEYDKKVNKYKDQKNRVAYCRNKIRSKDKELQAKKEDCGYEDYYTRETELKRKITSFFIRYDIMNTYEDITDALEIIRTKWNEVEHNFTTRENENKEKILVYKRISNFLKQLYKDDSIESDRSGYTKKLFERANIFGLTCTSREYFKPEAIEAFKKYALDGLNVKEQGIDTVIIDEVSKSSLLDLLIPILYGKTVILVGDHRQLPPMYDLRHMHEDDFEGLDPNIIDLDKNKDFTKLYEECYFKKLFENVPDKLRVMLTKQYRCHGDIMRVFNHFYLNSKGVGGLEIGTPQQNDQKQHGLLVKNENGKNIIEPNKHIYFIDCGDSFEKFGDSTSATNEKEAQVIDALTRKIDEEYGKSKNKFKFDKDSGIDERMSMGVICTYKDQVKLIKKKLPKNTLKNICELTEERFIISTVDDFQGDERDIIFVSMVRNPEPKKRKSYQAEFIRKFERINVALSRARRMLVIVGSKDFLSEAVIDLPDMGGNRDLDIKAYPIFREIINTIYTHGMVHKAVDIIREDK